MAHVYTISEEYSGPPVISLSLVAGGSLSPNTTYYYRAVTVDYRYAGTSGKWSPVSDVKSIATDDTNLSIKIDIVHPTGNDEYTLFWVHEGSDPGVGNWNDGDAFPDIRSLHNSSLYFIPMDDTKLSTWTDDGTHEAWSNDVYRLGNSANYGYVPLREAGRVRLDCSGGTLGDPITFDSIYAEAVAQGWDERATIEKLDLDDSAESPLGWLTGYRLNFTQCRIDSGRSGWFIDLDKLIILDGCALSFYCSTSLGLRREDLGATTGGLFFHLTGAATAFGVLNISGADEPIRVYDTRITVGGYEWARSTNYGGQFNVSGTDWEIVDLSIKGSSGESGLNDGPKFSEGDSGCLLQGFVSHRHRYSGQILSSTPFEINGAVFGPYGSTGLICYHNKSDDVERVFTGITIPGSEGSGETFYLQRRADGYTLQSKVATVDSEIFDKSRIRWYGGGVRFPEVPGSYCDFRNTVNVRVTTQDGDEIEGATVTCLNSEGTEEFSETTAADGTIAEQTVTGIRNEPDPNIDTSSYVGGVVTDYNPFTITVTADGYRDHVIVAEEIAEATSWEVSLTDNSSLDWSELDGVAAVPTITVEETKVESEVTVEGPGHSITVEES